MAQRRKLITKDATAKSVREKAARNLVQQYLKKLLNYLKMHSWAPLTENLACEVR